VGQNWKTKIAGFRILGMNTQGGFWDMMENSALAWRVSVACCMGVLRSCLQYSEARQQPIAAQFASSNASYCQTFRVLLSLLFIRPIITQGACTAAPPLRYGCSSNSDMFMYE
jgi:hypothetical protein